MTMLFLCKKCGETKTEDLFPRRKDGRLGDRVRGDCSECLRIYKKKYAEANKDDIAAKKKARYYRDKEKNKDKFRHFRYKRKYGITVEEFTRIANQQDNLCKLCRSPSGGKKRLCVDHDHVTGRFRGLLCIQCNVALGKLGDSVEGLERAIMYLKGLL